MKSLGAAVASALLGVASVYYGLVEFVKLDQAASAQLAAAVMAVIPYVRELFEKTVVSQQGAKRPVVISIGSFGTPPRRMVLYGTLIIVGAMALAAGVTRIGVKVMEATTVLQIVVVLAIVSALVVLPTVFSVGRWVGRRCATHGIIVVVLIGFFARLVGALLDTSIPVLLGDAPFGGILPSVVGLSIAVAVSAILFIVVGLVGYWRGSRERLAAYLSYLLRSVSEDTRKTIVDIAFEEARTATTRNDRTEVA
jgi:hypothetical protein